MKNPNKVYLGNSLYHNIRYTYQYRNRLFWGFTAEKDAGEPFGSYGNKAYDAYSFHFLLKDCGKLKACIGRLSFGVGEGLVVNSDFSLGKFHFVQYGRHETSHQKILFHVRNFFFQGNSGCFPFRKGGHVSFLFLFVHRCHFKERRYDIFVENRRFASYFVGAV